MAKRPIFLPDKSQKKTKLVSEVMLDFKWHPGVAPSQKKKNIIELHAAAKNQQISSVLEISTKSEDDLGRRLSAFNLSVNTMEHGAILLESAFQGSKVFEGGGPFKDLYGKEGRKIKKDIRLKESGDLQCFRFEGMDWGLEPKTAFYDWLYLNALKKEAELSTQLMKYQGFTDIEFNPKKSINCQARSCALYVALASKNIFKKALEDKNFFIELLNQGLCYCADSTDKQQKLFFNS